VTDRNPYFLPEATARAIFHDRIVPREFGHVVSHRDDGRQPIAAIVIGQPGAGKTGTADFVKAALDRRGGAAHVVGDFYKPYHRNYAWLMKHDPERASPLTSPDARRWITMAADYLIEQRADVLLESAGRDRADFADLAELFHRHGYRIDTSILAVNEAHSRLGILARYQDQVRKTGQGRLTARATHDMAYSGMLEAADFIDRSDAVDSVAVLRRGNDILYANERIGGRWQNPPGTRQAVEQERARAWTPAETQRFAATLNQLTNELDPEWHGELADIRRLAAPLAHPRVPLDQQLDTPTTAATVRNREPGRNQPETRGMDADAAHTDSTVERAAGQADTDQQAAPHESDGAGQDAHGYADRGSPQDRSDVDGVIEQTNALVTPDTTTSVEEATRAAAKASEALDSLQSQARAREGRQSAEETAREQAERDAEYDRRPDLDRGDPSLER
jgi:hypothetical protein